MKEICDKMDLMDCLNEKKLYNWKWTWWIAKMKKNFTTEMDLMDCQNEDFMNELDLLDCQTETWTPWKMDSIICPNDEDAKREWTFWINGLDQPLMFA